MLYTAWAKFNFPRIDVFTYTLEAHCSISEKQENKEVMKNKTKQNKVLACIINVVCVMDRRTEKQITSFLLTHDATRVNYIMYIYYPNLIQILKKTILNVIIKY